MSAQDRGNDSQQPTNSALEAEGPRLLPEDYGLPSRFFHYSGDSAEDRIGPFFASQNAEGGEAAFKVEQRHCNMMGICHGGVLMTFGDYLMGVTQAFRSGKAAVTVYCNNEFLSSAKLGDVVIGRGSISRETGSLFFLKGEVFVGDKLIFTCSSAFKKLK